MFSIGEFARLGSVSVRTLRHYDDVGLLLPAQVDEVTGYRRYSAHQLPLLNRIVALKELGFSLEQIRALTGDVTVEELRGMLRLRKAELETDLGEQQARLQRVEARLREIEREGEMPRHDFIVKSLPAQRVAAIGIPAPGFGPTNLEPILGPGILRLYEILQANGVDVLGQAFAFYKGDPERGDLVAYCALPIGDQTVELPEPVEIIELPPVEAALTVAGPGVDLYPGTYPEMARWIEDNGYEIGGHGRDVFVSTSRPESAEELLMEIQWPLKRPGGRS